MARFDILLIGLYINEIYKNNLYMKKILFLCISLLILGNAKAELKHSTAADGTVTLTLQQTGDLKNGYNGLPETVKNATKMVVVTQNGAQISSEDAYFLFGSWNYQNQFPNILKLDLENAKLMNDADLQWLGMMSKLEYLTFPKTTKEVPTQCLVSKRNNCIKEVIFPDNLENPDEVVNIGVQAFQQSKTLEKIIFKKGVGTIGRQCFAQCTALKNVEFYNGTKTIDAQAFKDCSKLEDIVLPEGLEEIKKGAFHGSAIKTIRLPNSLKYIRAQAFGWCKELKTITIPKNVELIERTAFQENYNLSDVYVLGTETKCAEQGFEPINTQWYTYNGAGTGEKVTRKDYHPYDETKMKTRTVFHYPKAAYEKYVNEDARKLGTSGYNRQYTTGEYGHKWAKIEDGRYNNGNNSNTYPEYKGWQDFMLIGGEVKEESWEDMKGDKWYTMCFPFEMTREQLESAYGATVEVVEFSGVKVAKDKKNNKTIKLEFKKVVEGSTKAHHPYMIHPGFHTGDRKGVLCTITGVDIKKAKENEKADLLKKVSFEADGVTYTFIGNYDDNKQLVEHSYYYYSGDDESKYKNNFYKTKTTAGTKWSKYAACILLNKDDGVKAKVAIEYADNEADTPTKIGTISVVADVLKDNRIYNINGQLINYSVQNMDKLPKGIYIINGKKFVKQ